MTNRNKYAEDQAAEDQRIPFFGEFRGRSGSRNRRQIEEEETAGADLSGKADSRAEEEKRIVITVDKSD